MKLTILGQRSQDLSILTLFMVRKYWVYNIKKNWRSNKLVCSKNGSKDCRTQPMIWNWINSIRKTLKSKRHELIWRMVSSKKWLGHMRTTSLWWKTSSRNTFPFGFRARSVRPCAGCLVKRINFQVLRRRWIAMRKRSSIGCIKSFWMMMVSQRWWGNWDRWSFTLMLYMGEDSHY